MTWFIVLGGGLFAGLISGILGFGASVMLIPVLTFAFGPKEAIPMMAIAALLANVARAYLWWRKIDWLACAAYTLPAIPLTVLGASIFVKLGSRTLEVVIGTFMLFSLYLTHRLAKLGYKGSLLQLAVTGGVMGFLTGLFYLTGPLNVPFFNAYGLTKGAFIGTEALGSTCILLAKSSTLRELGALPMPLLLHGLLVGASLMIGSYFARDIVETLKPHQFRKLLEAYMVVVAVAFLVSGMRGLI